MVIAFGLVIVTVRDSGTKGTDIRNSRLISKRESSRAAIRTISSQYAINLIPKENFTYLNVYSISVVV